MGGLPDPLPFFMIGPRQGQDAGQGVSTPWPVAVRP